MTKPSKPKKPLSLGDPVFYTHPANSMLTLEGTVSGEYGSDRLLVTTEAGHTWALKICDLFLSEVS